MPNEHYGHDERGLCAGEELTVAAEGADEQTAVDNIEKFLSGRVA